MKIRKAVHDLTAEDLRNCPVWEYPLNEDEDARRDESFVRPAWIQGPLDAAQGIFVVRAAFRLIDRTEFEGYLTPPSRGDQGFGVIRPTLFVKDVQLALWRGARAPKAEDLAKFYALLGRPARDVFPIGYESRVELVGRPVSGVISGFISRDLAKGRVVFAR